MSQLGDEKFHLQILNSIPRAIVACDSQGTITFWNQFAESVFGWNSAEIVGKSIRDIVSVGELKDGQVNLLPNATKSRKLAFLRKDGVRIEGQVVAGPAYPDSRNTIVYVIDQDTGNQNEDLTVDAAETDVARSQLALLENLDGEDTASVVLLRKVLDTFPFGVSIADSGGRIVFRNSVEDHIWGSNTNADSDLAEGRAAPDAASGQLAQPEDVALMRAIRKGDATLQETLEIGGPDDGRKTILSSAAPIRNQQAEIIGGVVVHQDITEQRRIEDAERKHRTFANALSNITATLTSSLDLPTVMERILDSVGRVVPHEAVNIMLVEDGAIRVAFWRNYGPKCDEIFREKRYSLDLPVIKRMLDTGLPQLIGDTRVAGDWIVFPETAWISSSVGVPIRARDEILGFLILDSSVPDFFTPPDAERLRAFAYQAAIAIENARLFSEIHEYATALETRVAERTAELRAAKNHVEAILEHSSDGFALVNDAGVITQVNPSFQQLFGLGENLVDSPTFADLVRPDLREAFTRALQDAQENQQSRRLELECYRRNGDSFDADVAIAPLFDAARNSQFYICNVRDVTRQKTSERELRSALEKEKQLNDLKSQFVAMVSHEFRTPLAVIQSSTDLLNQYHDRITDERRTELVSRIQSQVQWLSAMLEDVLMIAKADTFGLTLELEKVDLNLLCFETVHYLSDTVGKGREISVHPSDDPLAIELDQTLVKQMLTNMLVNAVKYSAEDSRIDLVVRATHDYASIEIRDQGIGVPKGDLEQLFDPFYRSENVGARPGTGLGLAVVMRTVRAHHGTISVESELGVGTKFIITLPRWQVQTDTGHGSPPGLRIVKTAGGKSREFKVEK